jgi:hypothetical protein
MANKEWLVILRQGIRVWNERRGAAPGVPIEMDDWAFQMRKSYTRLYFPLNLYTINLYRKGKPIVRWRRKVMDLSTRCVLVGRPPDRRNFLFGGFLF